MEIFVKYAYVFIIAIFGLVIFLIFSERIFKIKDNNRYNLFMNFAIIGLVSIIILSTLINSYNISTDWDPNYSISGSITSSSSFYVKMFNTIASKNMILFYGCVLYILYLNNTESFDNDFPHPMMDKIGLGKYLSNRSVGLIMLLTTIFVTARALHSSTTHSCGNVIEENIDDRLGEVSCSIK